MDAASFDPNLFHLDWGQLFEVLGAVVVLSFVVERVLALVFEHRLYVNNLSESGFKEPIAFALSLAVCIYWPLDLVSVILKSGEVTLFGEILTAGVIAGGSKASMKLFVDLMGVQSEAAKARKAVQDAAAAAGTN